jgi:hypothetical protein
MSPAEILLYLQVYIFYPEDKGSKLPPPQKKVSKYLTEYTASLAIGEYSSFYKREKFESYSARSDHCEPIKAMFSCLQI